LRISSRKIIGKNIRKGGKSKNKKNNCRGMREQYAGSLILKMSGPCLPEVSTVRRKRGELRLLLSNAMIKCRGSCSNQPPPSTKSKKISLEWFR
jgi:hypothetical protein